MSQPTKRLTVQEVVALAVGVLVVAAAVFITTQLRPMPFPFNFALSLGLGAGVYVGMLKVLDPRTVGDLATARAAAEYQTLVTEMKVIAARIWVASQHRALGGPTVQRLRNISSTVAALVNRYRADRTAFAGASATLTVLKQFDRVLAGYVKIKSGEQFVEPGAKLAEIRETEERTIPMVQAALQMLGEQLDAGQVVDKKVWEGTLASLLRSLNLIEAPNTRAAAWLENKEERQ
jgi:hypothetical protein